MNSPEPRYVVLTEDTGMHLVAIRYGEALPWLRVVAAFPSKDRAESYAEIENQFTGSDGDVAAWPDDLKYDTPAAEEPASILPRFLESRPATVAKPEPPKLPAVEPERLVGFSHTSEKTEASSVPAELASVGSKAEKTTRELVAEMLPLGRSYSQIAKAAGVSIPRIYQIVKELTREQAQPPETGATALTGESVGGIDVPSPQRTSSLSESGTSPGLSAAHTPEPPMGLLADARDAGSSPASSTINGHAPAGKLLVETNGITLREDAIVHGARSLAISTMELHALTVILKASPSPVGVPFILKRAWPHINQGVAESQLTHACKRLRERLPEIGLALTSTKGVGISVSVMEGVET